VSRLTGTKHNTFMPSRKELPGNEFVILLLSCGYTASSNSQQASSQRECSHLLLQTLCLGILEEASHASTPDWSQG
jgi:hypothetical protein